tara:strand:- start:315 stop:512 length:198 start_codon:yes stop_codon:yes gene_type:complete
MLSKVFLIKRGKCCGNRCLMCPYENRHSGESNNLRIGVIDNLEDWEKEELALAKIDISKREIMED